MPWLGACPCPATAPLCGWRCWLAARCCALPLWACCFLCGLLWPPFPLWFGCVLAVLLVSFAVVVASRLTRNTCSNKLQADIAWPLLSIDPTTFSYRVSLREGPTSAPQHLLPLCALPLATLPLCKCRQPLSRRGCATHTTQHNTQTKRAPSTFPRETTSLQVLGVVWSQV